MGATFVNYQARSNESDNVVQVVKDLVIKKAYVSPPKQGWVTIYDEKSDDEIDYYAISYICQQLSALLSTAIFAFIAYQGIYFAYLLYVNGELIDEFNSDPEGFTFGFDYFDYCDNWITEKFKGDANKLVQYSTITTDLQAINICLKNIQKGILLGKEFILGEEAIYFFAPLLGIDEGRATTGFRYFEDDLYQGYSDIIEDAQFFKLVQRL